MMGVLVNQFVSAQARQLHFTPESLQDTAKESRLGPLVCRESFHGMVIPPVGEAQG